ncbi:hypothetical protein LCGC14_2682100 [marine sediment metagenome]|uniref:Ribbon-helix-helix protein CopG domain-containing protein n=1 Tax=marine sediment metagenome TaxID=412755 RepID=A0A0F8ZL22_9ZZZZ
MKQYISIYLDVNIVEEVDKLAKKKERSRSWFVSKIIKEFLEKNK